MLYKRYIHNNICFKRYGILKPPTFCRQSEKQLSNKEKEILIMIAAEDKQNKEITNAFKITYR